MSIAEFLNGLPCYDERSFCHFIPKSCGNWSSSVYITTKDIPSEQIIVNDNSKVLLECLHNRSDKKDGCKKKKRELVETSEESGSTSRKHPRLDDIDITL